jgi:WD40 repeat protein
LEVEAKADTLRKTLDINADLLKETKSLNDLLALRIDTITIQKRELGEQFTIVQQQRNDIATANAALQVSNASLKDAFDTLEVKNKLTEAAKREADVQRDLAMEARTRSEITSNQLKALFMAAQSLETPSKDSAKALAERAYDLYTANGGSPYDSRIYIAMEKALDRISPQIQYRLDCYPVMMDYSPSKDLAAVMGLDGTLWGVRNVNIKEAVSPSMTSSKGNQINVLEYVPEIDRIIACNQSNALMVYDISGKDIRTISGHTEPVTSLKYLPGRKVLLSTSQSGDFRLTDGTWKSKAFPIQLPDPKNKITAIEVSPDEQYLVVGNNLTLTLYLWGDSARALGSVSLQSPIAKMAFNRDETILALGLENGEVWFYDWASKSLRPLMSHRSKVTAVGFSPDGKYFASGSFDQSLRLLRTYDLKSPPIALTGHGDWVTGLGFSADSKSLYSISKDKTIRHWYTQPEELKDALHQLKP